MDVFSPRLVYELTELKVMKKLWTIITVADLKVLHISSAAWDSLADSVMVETSIPNRLPTVSPTY